MSIISEGDYVLLVTDYKKRWLVKVQKGREHHTHRGIIKHDDLIGREYGCKGYTSLGVEYTVFKPVLSDLILKMQRSTQIIYPKDVGIILSYTGLSDGARVAEAGVGSGGLTIYLANAVKPHGKIYGYDIRDESLAATERNLIEYGLSEYVELKKHDVCEGFLEKDLDAVILDLATPWLVVEKAYSALKGSGILVNYSPTIEQTQKAVYAMGEAGFRDIKTFECILREIMIREDKGTRPATLMIGHTGYMTFARKTV
ncbi:MAG: tRNA (adenine-N1)-methyltransferase [Candidatus Odinarchaeum yellowstonii]|uniref:tRNA (Adenine-N1)-methyltransferase n=1 Tax=Odinarchaeota yellowstonii (strain LCB_4) TaxID=1841599 RepID=A0AAF0D1Q8_ODILC|nr:MAG: tRNA (adenine-N1)-methyltransferase [Candidatus Odinarchaeum yellowstonii]